MVHKLRSTPRIFLSYSHKDRTFGVQLVEALRKILNNDDYVWYDDGLHGGDAWWDEIVDQLNTRNAFIVILSPDAVKSKYVREEMRIAWHRHIEGKMLFLPLLLRKCRTPKFLRTRQIISFLSPEDYEQSLKKLLEPLNLPFNNIDISTFLNYLQGTSVKENSAYGNVETAKPVKIRNITQTFQTVRDAFEMQDWDYVIAVVNKLTELYRGSLPASIYYMQGRAYLYTETGYNNQYAQAQEALEYALSHVHNANLRLELLDAYAFSLIQQNLKQEVEFCIDQALQLSPDDPVWRLLQEEMPLDNREEIELPPELISSKACETISKPEIGQDQKIEFFADLARNQKTGSSSKGLHMLKMSGLALLLTTPFFITPIAHHLLKKGKA